MSGPVADDMGLVAVPRHRAAASPAVCLTIAVAAALRTAKLPRSLALQDGIVASRRRPGALRQAGFVDLDQTGQRAALGGGHGMAKLDGEHPGACPGSWQSAATPRDVRAPYASRSRDIRRQSGPVSPCPAEAGPKASGRDTGGCSLQMALQPAAEVRNVVSSGTFSRTAPAKRRTLSVLQAGPPSPGHSGYKMTERSARATSPAADTAVAPCRRPSDASAQCEPPVAPHGIRGRPSARKISRRVLRLCSRLAKVNCRRRCMS